MDQSPGRFPPPPSPDRDGVPQWSSPQPQFYPLDLNRIVSLTWSLYRFRWRLFVGLAVLLTLPAWIILGGQLILTGGRSWAQILVESGGGATLDQAAFTQTVLIELVGGLMLGLVVYVANGVLIHAATAVYYGRRADATTAIRASLTRLPSFVAVVLIVMLVNLTLAALGVFLAAAGFLALGGGTGFVAGPAAFLALIIFVAMFAVMIFISIRWSMMIQVLIVEGAPAIAALRRSWRIVTGSFWRVLGYTLLFGFVIGLIGVVIGLFVTLLLNPVRVLGPGNFVIDPSRLAIATTVAGILSSVLIPITVIAMTLLYFDLRWRRGEKVPAPGEAQQPAIGAPEGQSAMGATGATEAPTSGESVSE